ncbi:MAG: hypothetical protein CMB64_06880 [Euryarchaeota archaeon]|nr:hypothetical protein [Euryarchaeota archaeon]|tara:strand:+ start:919 stop:1854 length:936 start_codon:yes stop_codon:yes gene_type:complete
MSTTSTKKQKNKEKIESEYKELNVQITKISQNVNRLYDERQSLNLMSLAMNNNLENIQGLPKDQQEILVEVQERQKKANELRELRDKINSDIILPEQAILENLYLYYYRLTGEENDLRYPSLKKEAEMFSRFLELQQMFTLKLKSTEYHQEYQQLMKEQLSTIEKLNEIRKKSGKEKLQVSSKNKNNNSPVGYKIFKINKKISTNKRKLNELRKKKSKLEFSLGKRTSNKRKYKVPDLSSIQDKISEGSSISLNDLSTLLKHGKGIENLEKSNQKSKNSEKQVKNIPRRKVQTSRGRRRAGPRDSSLKNDR